MQQTPNGGPTNGEPLATQSSAKPANRFMRPLHPRGRITCRNILQQILQSLDDSRIFFFDRFTATTRLAYSVGGILKGLFLVCKTTANRVRAHAGNLSSVFDGSSTRLACQVGNEQASPFFVKGCDHPIDGSMLFSSGTLGRFSTIPTGTLANPSMYCSGHNNLPLRLPREGKLIIPETFKLFPDISLRTGRQEDQADAEGRVGDHPGTFARCRGRVDPEHDPDLMKGNPVSADFDELMNEGEMYSDSIREANEPVGSEPVGSDRVSVNLKLGLTPMKLG